MSENPRQENKDSEVVTRIEPEVAAGVELTPKEKEYSQLKEEINVLQKERARLVEACEADKGNKDLKRSRNELINVIDEKDLQMQRIEEELAGSKSEPVVNKDVPAKSEKYSEEEKRQMGEIRGVADVTLNRIKSYDEVGAVTRNENLTEEQRDKKFAEAMERTWSADLVVHGVYPVEEVGTDKKYKKNYPDADGKMALELLKLAGIDTSRVQFVNPGESVRGKINIDTGDKNGVVAENSGYKLTVDHHGPDAKNDTCSAEKMFELLAGQGKLNPESFMANGRNYLKETLDFITKVDNKTFPLSKEQFNNYHRTVFGLAQFIDSEVLIKFFKDGGDPMKILSDSEIAKLDPRMGNKDKDEKDLLYRSKGLGDNILKSKEALSGAEKQGIIIDSPAYGKIVVDIAKTNKDGSFVKMIPCGIDAVRSHGDGAYVFWNPDKKSFAISTVGDFKPEHKFGQGVDMRGRHMWIKPIRQDGEDLTVTLGEILSVLTDGKLNPEGKLKEYLDKEAGKTLADVIPAPKKNVGKKKESEATTYEDAVGMMREQRFTAEQIAPWRSKENLTEAETKVALTVDLVKTFDSVVEDLGYGKGTLYGKEKTDVNYRHVVASFKAVTGRDLNEEARVAAKGEAEAGVNDKHKRIVMKKSEWNNPENVARFAESVEKRNYSAAIRFSWNKLGESEKKKYKGDPKNYANALEVQREELWKNVVELNRDAYYDLIRQGYKPENFKVTKAFWSGKETGIKMISPDGKPVYKTTEELTKMEVDLGLQKRKQVKEAMDKMLGVAVANWRKRKVKAAAQIIVKEFGSAALAENLYEDNFSKEAVLKMSPEEAARNVWAPRILSIEDEKVAVEEDAKRRLGAMDAIVKKIAINYKIGEKPADAISEYIKTGKGKLPKVPANVSKLIALLISKREQIGQWLTGKLKSSDEQLLKVGNQQEGYFVSRITNAIEKI